MNMKIEDLNKLSPGRLQLRKDLNIRTHRVSCCYNCPLYQNAKWSNSKVCLGIVDGISSNRVVGDDRSGIPEWCPRKGQDMLYMWNNE